MAGADSPSAQIVPRGCGYAPPTDAERGVIGAVLVNEACLQDVLQIIDSRDFGNLELAELFAAMERGHRAGRPADARLLLYDSRLAAKIKEYRVLLAEIADEDYSPANAAHYSRIVKNGSLTRKVLDSARQVEVDAKSGKSAYELIAAFRTSLDDACESGSESLPFNRLTSAQLDSSDFELDYLIEGILVSGQSAVIGGAAKTLKTSIAVDLAVSLATAGSFLGRFQVSRPCNVLMMSGESGLATLQNTALRISHAAGVKLADLSRLIWSDSVPRFDRADHISVLDKLIESESIEVLIVDPAYLAMPSADPANLMAQGQLLRSIGEVCQRRGVTLIVLHHTKRTLNKSPHDAPGLEDLAWAGFAEFFRQWLMIGRREEYRPGSGRHSLWLNVGGSAGHTNLLALTIDEGKICDIGGRHWSVTVESDVEAIKRDQTRREERKRAEKARRVEASAKADCQVVVEVMASIGRPDTQAVISSTGRISGDRTKAALLDLVARGLVNEIENGVKKENGHRYTAYQLCSDHPDTPGGPHSDRRCLADGAHTPGQGP